jgi:hypothetical protein
VAWPPSFSTGELGWARPSELEAAACRRGPSLRRRVVEPPDPAKAPDSKVARRALCFGGGGRSDSDGDDGSSEW